MMRHLTEEELRLMDKLNGDKPLSEEEKIKQQFIEIDKKETKDWTFCH